MDSNLVIRSVTEKDREWIASFMAKSWGGEPLIVRGEKYYPSQLPGLIAVFENKIEGLLSYLVTDGVCEIIVFEVFNKFKGLGTQMIDELKKVAIVEGCTSIQLMTTNDNLDAFRFYQRRGFVISGIHLDTVREARKIKPSIVEIGDYGIPIRDEIDLKLELK